MEMSIFFQIISKADNCPILTAGKQSNNYGPSLKKETTSQCTPMNKEAKPNSAARSLQDKGISPAAVFTLP